MMMYCFQYLVAFTELPLDMNFKVCAEFWFEFTSELLNGKNQPMQGGPLVLNLYGNSPQEMTLLNSVYPKVLIDLRKVVVSKMAKP
jgi:hypothetical protein